MAVVADWHGRVTATNINLRGPIDRACRTLLRLHRGFDRKQAARPLYKPPPWAASLIRDKGTRAMTAWLAQIHPTQKKGKRVHPDFKKLIQVYRALDSAVDLINFCTNYITACEKRAPPYGKRYAGYESEYRFLQEMTFCRNDRIKFRALTGFARFAPVHAITFFPRRIDEKHKECNNPNIILCNAMKGIGIMAGRFSGMNGKDSVARCRFLLGVLPVLTTTLDREGRNNSACSHASSAIAAIAEKTGAPAALEAYLHNLSGPPADSDWLRKHTDRYHRRILPWLHAKTGKTWGADHGKWQRWFKKSRSDLYYDQTRKVFVLSPKKAKAFRQRLRKG